MSHCDPIADMITRIRNAVRVQHPQVNVKATRVCEGVAKVLVREGYIEGYDRIETGNQDNLKIRLKYGPLGQKVIRKIDRCSKLSCRVHCSVDKLPTVMGGLGIAVVSTNRGVLSDQQCRKENLGGELLCIVR